MAEPQDTIEYYERIRRQQISDGTYDPNLNGNLAYDTSIDNRKVIDFKKIRPVSAYQKYLEDKTLI